jgi:hypothetical protein
VDNAYEVFIQGVSRGANSNWQAVDEYPFVPPTEGKLVRQILI